jgi:hypothetical protein
MDRLCGLAVRVPDYRYRGLGLDSRRYQIFWEVVGMERGSLSLVSTIEELLGINSSGSGLENRKYGRGDPLLWPHDTLYRLKLALTSPTSCGRSVGIARLRTKTTEFSLVQPNRAIFRQHTFKRSLQHCEHKEHKVILDTTNREAHQMEHENRSNIQDTKKSSYKIILQHQKNTKNSFKNVCCLVAWRWPNAAETCSINTESTYILIILMTI